MKRRYKLLFLRSSRLLRLHAMKLVTGVVLIAVAGIALRNDAFEVGTTHQEATSATLGAESTATAPAQIPLPATSPPRQREHALVYLVTDDFHAWQIASTLSTLVWDNPEARAPHVHFLVAGTPETQAAAIQQLNGLIEIASMQRVDLRVLDLRPGRGVPATATAP